MRPQYWLLLVRIASHNTRLIQENRKLKIDLAEIESAYNTQKWLTERYKDEAAKNIRTADDRVPAGAADSGSDGAG